MSVCVIETGGNDPYVIGVAASLAAAVEWIKHDPARSSYTWKQLDFFEGQWMLDWDEREFPHSVFVLTEWPLIAQPYGGSESEARLRTVSDAS